MLRTEVMADLFDTAEPSFPEFWIKYPRKVAKAAAEKAYQKAIKTSPHAAIMASLDFMLATEWKGRDREYLPHASTFLNRERFDGDPRESYEAQSDAITAKEQHTPNEHYCTACEAVSYTHLRAHE